MFNKDAFIAYVGDKSGTQYASGLGRIEKLYGVDIDAAYVKDGCASLLEQIEQDKLRVDLDARELKLRKDIASHLKRYIAFRSGTKESTASDAVAEKIAYVISHYKANFDTVAPQEQYKWEGIGWYKSHWDINASDFAGMVEVAFSKMANLLASGMYYPYKMLVKFAQYDAESVRSLFKMLYNEDLPLAQRYTAFREGFEKYIEQLKKREPDRDKGLQHFQDLRAVMVYLTCEYPEKYFLFKSRMFTTFRDRVGYVEEKPKQKSVVWKVESYTRMCQLILEQVKQDEELIAMSKARLDDYCYQDKALHLLTMDIVFYGSVYMSEDDFRMMKENFPTDYWPSLEEYNPGITAEKWSAVLADTTLTSAENLAMLRKMLELGGESTCSHLAEVYGNVHSYYNKLGSSFGEKVKRKLNCPDCIDDGAVRYFPIPFVGRYVTENGNKRYSWKLRDELKEALMNMDISEVTPVEESTTDVGLNTILYGPPGTGKTYHTVIYAVAIVENKELKVVAQEDYSDVLERYSEYKAQGRIEFTTFHQSYGYEEFIEGIKPVISSEENGDGEAGDIQYSVQPGVFKKFCERAQRPGSVQSDDFGINDYPNVWKVSLWATGDNPVRAECLKNNHIRIGWDAYGPDISDETDFVDGGSAVLNAFMNRMQIGDIVFSCYSASTIDAIGVVVGEHEWDEGFDEFKRLRKVNWIVKGIQENILSINGGRAMVNASIYRMANVALSDVYQLIEKYRPATIVPAVNIQENYVFIIDEINRGNISKVFGELITLVEPAKRLGQTEEMKAMLPYSQKPFGVPKNVYIIGTMNTADRSIATIDTALRRRFFFKEMLPDAKVLAKVSVEDLSISDLLTRMNKRIEVLYDREHTIGHAYFMPLRDNPTIETLAEIFKNNIIPLLQEYFYEDYEKIRLVLGDNQKDNTEDQFIIARNNDYAELFGDTGLELDEGCSYEVNYAAFGNPEAYRSI